MIYLTVLIFVKEGKEVLFEEYESAVLPILNEYNGTLIYRIRPSDENFINLKEESPYELHFISFESEQDFKSYLNDDKRKSFEKLKVDSIKSTVIVQGKTL